MGIVHRLIGASGKVVAARRCFGIGEISSWASFIGSSGPRGQSQFLDIGFSTSPPPFSPYSKRHRSTAPPPPHPQQADVYHVLLISIFDIVRD